MKKTMRYVLTLAFVCLLALCALPMAASAASEAEVKATTLAGALNEKFATADYGATGDPEALTPALRATASDSTVLITGGSAEEPVTFSKQLEIIILEGVTVEWQAFVEQDADATNTTFILLTNAGDFHMTSGCITNSVTGSYTLVNNFGTLTVSGGDVSTSHNTATAINVTSGTLTLSGGVVFGCGTRAYSTADSAVVQSPAGATNWTPNGGTILAWNKEAAGDNPIYTETEADNLVSLPTGARWGVQVSGSGDNASFTSGITYGTNGFLPVDGVKVLKLPTKDDLSYTIPTNAGPYTIFARIEGNENYAAFDVWLSELYNIDEATVDGVDQTVYVKPSAEGATKYTFDLDTLLPSVPWLKAEDVRYAVTAPETPSVLNPLDYTSGNSLTLPVKPDASGTDQVEILIAHKNDNYKNISATISVTVTDKTPVNIKLTGAQSVEYTGQPQSYIVEVIDTDTGEAIPGGVMLAVTHRRIGE